MARLVLILLIITGISLGVAWIADVPGRVAVDWGNYHIEASPLVVLAAIAVLALWCMIFYYVLVALFLAPRTWLRSRLARRQQLGLEALTGAFAAIATQDLRNARKQIGRAQQYLPHQPLTLMLASQVARLEGNESQSRLYLEQMLKAESTEFMALRGLIENARRSGDDAKALELAEKALALKPKDSWLAVTLTGLYVAAHRTDDALRLLAQAARRRIITRAQRRTLTAGALYEYARPLVDQQRFDLAVPALEEALRDQPDLAPASALLVKAHLKQDHLSRALRVIAAGWKVRPHPLLAQTLLACLDAKDARKKVVRQAEKMARMHPGNRESGMLLAAIALREEHADAARSALKPLIEERETVRACTLMAQAESALGDNAESTQWVKRSHAAVADPAYTCEACRRHSPEWHFSCPHCGSVGTMIWG